jgi:hypothetical protein
LSDRIDNCTEAQAENCPSTQTLIKITLRNSTHAETKRMMTKTMEEIEKPTRRWIRKRHPSEIGWAMEDGFSSWAVWCSGFAVTADKLIFDKKICFEEDGIIIQ